MTGRRLIFALCAAQVLTMAGVFAFPALLPTFIAEWGLSKTQAGWIAGLYFASYALVAPPVLALTDRIDARLVLLAGTLTTVLSAAGFALLADGFWSALAFRVLAGASLAATYLPGLRALVDRYRSGEPSRAISVYTSCFSLGTALSFFAAGETAAAFGWRAAFGLCALAGLAAAVVPLLLPRLPPERAAAPASLLDLRPVLANRRALAFVLGYGVHCWELFAMRSWLVALLAFVVATDGGGDRGFSPTTVATLAGLVAMAASISGNELCVRFGRVRVIVLVMFASALMAAGFGFAAALPYPLLAALALLYAALIPLDSAALTAGAIAAAAPGQRGATLALHAFVGFSCAGLGPLLLGVVLDATGGGTSALSWGAAFVSVAVVGLLGPPAMALGQRDQKRRSSRSR
ncbi:MAG TPA: MFS transporter [Rhodospirillales bacterium]|nr:MFS transporter [Rhodospirillales bacterium]